MAASLATAAELPAPERVRFDSLDRVDGAAVRIDALLFVPEGPPPATGRPAVIALHGCGGLYGAGARKDELGERHAEKARAWLEAGYAVLFPDSLRPRGVREICTVRTSERRLHPSHRRLDALGALTWLGAQADIDPQRIALVGWSHGGSTVLATIDATDARVEAWRRQPGRPAFFRAAVAFYPGCSATLRRNGWRPAVPLTLLIGAADDWTPAAPCEALAARLHGATPGVDLVVYPDAHHGFDAPTGTVRVRRDVPNGVGAGGVHVGPHREAREHANAKLAQVLREALDR